MTFKSLIRLLDVLDHDGEILVTEDISEGLSDYDNENMRRVEIISSESDISDSVKYFTESRYSLYVYEKYKFYYELEKIK